MKKTLLFLIAFLFFWIHSFADTPGKKAMSDSRISFKNIGNLSDYTFFWQGEYDSATIVKSDTTLIIPGSGGRPMNATFWAVNNKTQVNTDTIFLSNYYAPDYSISIDTVYGNKLSFTKNVISDHNSGGDRITDTIDKNRNSGQFSNIGILCAASLIALVLLLWLFIKKRARFKQKM